MLAKIRAVIEASPFNGEGYRKVWARLRHQGLRTSRERVRRLMRENGLSATTRLAPRAFASQAMALWFLGSAAGQNIEARRNPNRQ